MSSVPLGVDERDAVDVACKDTHGLGITLPERSPVPDLYESVVATRRDHVRRRVHEGDCVDVVVVRVDPERLRLALAVKEIDVTVVGTAEDLAAVGTKANRKEAEAAVVGAQGKGSVHVLVAKHAHLVY
jgi:hypothetical protein